MYTNSICLFYVFFFKSHLSQTENNNNQKLTTMRMREESVKYLLKKRL